MKIFNLPDLGEGLPDAEIVEWLVAEGDAVTVDQPMVSMETAKAVVEVPSPYTGTVANLFGQNGDVIDTGAPLVGFDVADGEDAEDDPAPSSERATAEAPAVQDERASAPAPAEDAEDRPDTGTVVGAMESSDRVVREAAASIHGVKVTPAVRALARKLKVDLRAVKPSGRDGVVTAADVRQAAEDGSAPLSDTPPSRKAPQETASRPPASEAAPPKPQPRPQSAPPPSGDHQPVRGPRRAMARSMAASHAEVVPTTLMDDADIHAWKPGQDITVRLLRALVVGSRAEPSLNAWYDGKSMALLQHKRVDIGIAVDTEDGLFVPALRDCGNSSAAQLRSGLDRMRENVRNRSIPPEDLKDYTIILSNFGVFAGRYATPVVVPPCVAIVAAGKLLHEVVPVLGGFEVHRVIPLSLTFDHRAATGGEAARFLKAALDDLALPE